MSDNASAHQRPSVWSYASFSSPRRRSSSLRLPQQESNDSADKADRYHKSNGKTSYSESMSEKITTAWMHQSQRTRYIKTGCLILFALLVVYYIVPGRYSPENVGSSVSSSSATGGDPALSTTKCSRSYAKGKPLVQYALMIDAGSTGSRIHVYKFNNCGPTPELEDEVFLMTPKKEGGSGLSSYKSDAEGAAKSLDMLMDKAVETVPDKLKSCTPVAVKATAGLRKLGTELSDAILQAVRHRLETVYPFPVVDEAHGGVEVMDGTDEGVYAWITTNYLLGRLSEPDRVPTAAVFDLGGGSTQIVFEPTFKHAADGGMPEEMKEGDHKYKLSFGGRDYALYQHSYLGYGLMEARNNLHRLIIETLYESHGSADFLAQPITNPCIIPGMSREVPVSLSADHPLGVSVTVNMTGGALSRSGSDDLGGGSSAAQCRGLAERTLHKDASCALTPCAFAGVHQPSMARTFAREDVYLLSYFYDRTEPLGMPESFALRELKELAARVCHGPAAGAWAIFDAIPGAMEELADRPESCLDLNFMLALLHAGYEMPIDREVRIAKKVRGNELGWCLGASLPLLEQQTAGWKCRVDRVA